MKTHDRGNTWSGASPPGISYCTFSFSNDTTGYLMAPNYGIGTSLWRMEDSVLTLVRLMNISSKQLIFINQIDGYILDGNNIYKTTTEGLVWDLDTIPLVTLNKIW